MRITVFGGTGPTGLLLIQQALNEGHTVVAYARTPSKLPVHDNLTVAEGQLEGASAIAEAVRGSDAVLSPLGLATIKADSSPLAAGYRHITAAMREHGVKRLVALGPLAMTDPADGKDLRIALMVRSVRTFARPLYDALVTIGGLIRQSGPDPRPRGDAHQRPPHHHGQCTQPRRQGRPPALPRQRRRLHPPPGHRHQPDRQSTVHQRHMTTPSALPAATGPWWRRTPR